MIYRNIKELPVCMAWYNSERSHLYLWLFFYAHWHSLVEFNLRLQSHEVSEVQEPVWQHIHEGKTCPKPNNLFWEVSHNHVQSIAHVCNTVHPCCLDFIYFTKAVELLLLLLLSSLTEVWAKKSVRSDPDYLPWLGHSLHHFLVASKIIKKLF